MHSPATAKRGVVLAVGVPLELPVFDAVLEGVWVPVPVTELLGVAVQLLLTLWPLLMLDDAEGVLVAVMLAVRLEVEVTVAELVGDAM